MIRQSITEGATMHFSLQNAVVTVRVGDTHATFDLSKKIDHRDLIFFGKGGDVHCRRLFRKLFKKL